MNDRPERKPEPPGRRASIALAVAVHVLLAILLIYGIHWPSDRPEAVEVELVAAMPEPVAAAPEPEPAPEPKPEPKPEPRPQPPPPKPEPKVSPKPPPKPDIAIKEKEKPTPTPKEEPKPKFDPSEMLKRDEKEFAARRQQAAQNAAIDKELTALKAAQASAARNKGVADYLSKIRAKIRGNILVPPDVRGNPEAVFDVTQLPSGEILSVRLKKSSGHAALDAAIERAILKSSPLPKPDSPGLFERQLELRFRPLDD